MSVVSNEIQRVVRFVGRVRWKRIGWVVTDDEGGGGEVRTDRFR